MQPMDERERAILRSLETCAIWVNQAWREAEATPRWRWRKRRIRQRVVAAAVSSLGEVLGRLGNYRLGKELWRQVTARPGAENAPLEPFIEWAAKARSSRNPMRALQHNRPYVDMPEEEERDV